MESVFQLCNPLAMYKRMKLFLLMAGTFLGIAAPFVQGQEDDSFNCIVSSQASSQEQKLPSCAELYPQHLYSDSSSPWRIGFSAGLGERSNPLINSDDIPIYGVIQLSYFGERFFFDNGDIGWHLTSGENWSTNLIAGIGGERSFYSFLNSSSVGFESVPADQTDQIEVAAPSVEAPERDMTVDGGVEFLFSRGNSEFQLQLLGDISNQHQGQEIWFSWGHIIHHSRWQIAPSIGFNWKSDQAANYFYGVREEEASPDLPMYQVDAALNVFGRLTAQYSLNDHWKVVSVFQYEWLADEITASPAVQDDYVQTAFLGLYYEF